MARREADRQARRVPWKHLLEARRQYLEWNAFSLWVGAIIETEGQVPASLAQILESRCPGLVRCGPRTNVGATPQDLLGWRGISEWIESNILGQAKDEGWLRAVTYYAARDPDFLRDCAYWQHCVRQWKQQRPLLYPSFEEWRKASEHCDDEVLDAFEMREGRRQIIKAIRAIGPERLAEAVTQYVEWEAFTYWLRSLLEADTKFPDIVTKEVQSRCPGFLEYDKELRSTLSPENYARRWKALVEWGENRFFVEARKEGWFDALVSYARAHPRSARTVDYWVFYWDEHWLARSLGTYPSFQEWRQAADDYVVQSGNE
jgi:hypothetical protein